MQADIAGRIGACKEMRLSAERALADDSVQAIAHTILASYPQAATPELHESDEEYGVMRPGGTRKAHPYGRTVTY